MASIEFDAAGLVKDLDVFAKVQVPYMAAVTVNRLAGATKLALQREMLDSFERTSPFTFKSLEQVHFATKAEPWTVVQHKTFAGKGNAAANYLLPQITGGMVYRTRFQNRLNSELEGYNGSYMLPLEKSEGAKLNAMGEGVFAGPTKLTGGIYFVVTNLAGYQIQFDLLMDDKQQFTIQGDTSNSLKQKSKITGSEENKMYEEYKKFSADQEKMMQELEKSFTEKKEKTKKEKSPYKFLKP